MSTYRILSIDGGGVRGVIPARLLHRIVSEKPEILDKVDLFAGTSTGAIVCAALAFGLSTTEVFNLYRDRSVEIFERSWTRVLGMQVVIAKYSHKGLYRILTDTFGDVTLGDLKKKVIINALDIDAYDSNGKRSYKPKFFHNLEGQCEQDLSTKLVDILMYTTAAPTFFPTYGGYVDGGLVANNPSVAALAQALDPKTLPQPTLNDLCMMSIGTGKVTTYVPGNSHDWGFLQWAGVIIEMMMNGSVAVADYECKQLLKDKYIRINPYLDEDFRLDSVEHIDRMVEAADSYDISEHIAWLNKHF